MESILTSIKKLLGVDKDYPHFDADIITHINSVLFILNQVGVGPSKGFRITGDNETWEDYIPGIDEKNVESLRTYIYQKVKLVFDPPTSSIASELTKESANELEWRLNVAAESINFDSEEEI